MGQTRLPIRASLILSLFVSFFKGRNNHCHLKKEGIKKLQAKEKGRSSFSKAKPIKAET